MHSDRFSVRWLTCSVLCAVLLLSAYVLAAPESMDAVAHPDTTIWGRNKCTPNSIRHVYGEMFDWRVLSAEFELANVRSCDVIVLGSVVAVEHRSVNDWEDPMYPSRVAQTVVTLVVEERIKGVCSDTLSFHVESGGSLHKEQVMLGKRHLPDPSRERLVYREGERVIALLEWRDTPYSGRILVSSSVQSKYLVSPDGSVPRKGVRADSFLDALRSAVEERSALRLAELADFVVECEVLKQEVYYKQVDWDPLSGYSDVKHRLVTLRSKASLGGESVPEVLTLELPARDTMAGIDTPIFARGEQVLMFLRRGAEGGFSLVGGHDGKRRLSDPETQSLVEFLGNEGH